MNKKADNDKLKFINSINIQKLEINQKMCEFSQSKLQAQELFLFGNKVQKSNSNLNITLVNPNQTQILLMVTLLLSTIYAP